MKEKGTSTHQYTNEKETEHSRAVKEAHGAMHHEGHMTSLDKAAPQQPQSGPTGSEFGGAPGGAIG